MTIAEQAIDKVASDETGAAGNDAFHDRTYPLQSRARTGRANQNFAGADYQPTEDSASVTNLFR